MRHIFLFGSLLDPELRKIVLGTDTQAVPAHLPDHAVERAKGGDWPVLTARAGAAAHGLLVPVDDMAAGRADFYEAAFACLPKEAEVSTDTGLVLAMLYHAPEGEGSGTAWDLSEWQRTHGPLTRLAAEEAMRLHGKEDAATLRSRMPTIRVRAFAATRARAMAAPRSIRSDIHRDQIRVLDHRQPYQHYFAVGETNLRHPTFAGDLTEPMERAAFHAADAVTVLPFDPVRRRVLLIEQFRYGPWLRGDPYPWQLEPPAGRIDPGESAEEAARREAREEARVELSRLHRVAGFYAAPGAITEFVDSFVGIADLPDTAAGLGGVAAEQEDIRSHVLPLETALELIETGEASTGPLVMSLLWLDRALRRGDPL